MAQRGIINRRMIDTLRDAPPEIVSEALALSVTPDMVPQTDVELIACLASWEWRIFSGQLYKIMTKDPEADEDDETAVLVVPFIPNRAQRKFLDRLHTRNVILKARQLGFTTLIAILWLDHALFNADQRCAIIAHSLEDAGVILRDKVKFAFNNLPAYLIGEEGQNELPLLWLSKDSETEIVFGHNNSSVRVATSARSGTYHRLHVSEMGKIGAKFPLKAKEIVTGSLPTVPKTGITVIESTAEGRSGEFYRIATRAEKNTQIAEATGRRLAAKAWNFHFFPWWEETAYVEDPANVDLTPADEEYFLDLEAQIGCKITPEQRAWYVMTREDEQGGDAEKMWQEYPSTPEEAWKASTEGTWFAKQLAAARKQGRIVPSLPKLTTVATHTFWDIGHGDGTSIWLGQEVGELTRFLAACFRGGDEKLSAMIAKEVQPDIREVWTPTAANFFSRVGGPYLVDLWRDLLELAEDHPTVTTFAKLKKADKAAKLEALFSDADTRSALGLTEAQVARIDGWLPEGMS